MQDNLVTRFKCPGCDNTYSATSGIMNHLKKSQHPAVEGRITHYATKVLCQQINGRYVVVPDRPKPPGQSAEAQTDTLPLPQNLQKKTNEGLEPVFLGNPDTWPAPTAPITENACYSTAAAALDGLAAKLKSPSVLDLIQALRSKDDQHLKRVFDSNRSTLLQNKTGKTPANLFGFMLPGLGYCPVICHTVMSSHIDGENRDKLHLPGVNMDRREKKKFNWDTITGFLDGFSSSDELTEIRALLCAGLVPWSMTGDLGEEERKSACNRRCVTFKLEDPRDSSVPGNFADNLDGWKSFFGVPGYTKVSHILSVTHRSSSWSKPAHDGEFVVDGIMSMIVQSWPSYCRDLPVGMRVNGSQYLPLYTYNGLAMWPRIKFSQNGENHTICFIIVTALLVSDHLYAHTHQRGGLTVVNGRLVGNPICLGGNGRLEAPFTMLSRNTRMNLHAVAAENVLAADTIADKKAAAAKTALPQKRARTP
jgi:hypothetical protein